MKSPLPRALAPFFGFLLFLSAASAQEVTRHDRSFVKKASQDNLLEIALGNAAVQKSVNSQLKSFGATMVAEHTKGGAELQALADRLEVKLDDELGRKPAETLKKVAPLSGAEFDKAYLSTAVAEHQRTVALFAETLRGTQNPDVKAYVEKTLPILRGHLEKIAMLQVELK